MLQNILTVVNKTMTNYVDKNKLYKDKWLLLTNPKEEV